jgi:hypothetical protein
MIAELQRAAQTLKGLKFPFKSNSAVMVHSLGRIKPGTFPVTVLVSLLSTGTRQWA